MTTEQVITQEQFLQAIFGDRYREALVVSFPEDPATRTDWSVRPFGEQPMPSDHNAYYTVSLFKPDTDGRVRRTRELFTGMHVVAIDDCAERIPLDRLLRLPSPSIKVQTSKGSEQWLWLLQEPETCTGRIASLQQGLVELLCEDGKDTGFKSAQRLLRLPQSANSKAKRVKENNGQPFPVYCSEWSPERRYTLDAIAAALDIDLTTVAATGGAHGAAGDMPDHPIWHTPGLTVLRHKRGGWANVECPFKHLHSDGGKSLTGAAVRVNADATLGWTCHHGVCIDDHGVPELLAELERHDPGFGARLKMYQMLQGLPAVAAPVSAGVAPPPPGSAPVTTAQRIMAMGINGDEILKTAKKQIYIMKGVAAHGQYTTLYAPTGIGKTMLTLWLLEEGISEGRVDGSKVLYINIDDDLTNAAVKQSMIKDSGITMIVGGVGGFSTKDAVDMLAGMTADGSASGMIVIIDTLKKVTDPQNKSKFVDFGTIAREFTVAGGSLIVIGHTNKYTDDEGKHVYSGTADGPQDCDATRMIEPVSKVTGFDTVTHTVRIEGGKVRGKARRDVTFEYNQRLESEEAEERGGDDRHDGGADYREMYASVRRLTGAAAQAVNEAAVIARLKIEDDAAINAITDVLTNSDVVDTNKSAVVKRVTEHHGIPRRTAVAILDRYTGQLWCAVTGKSGRRAYSLNQAPAVPVVSFL